MLKQFHVHYPISPSQSFYEIGKNISPLFFEKQNKNKTKPQMQTMAQELQVIWESK